jgi:hypothetical protein
MTMRLVAAQLWRIRWHLMLLVFFGANGAIQSTGIGARFGMVMPLVFATVSVFTLGMFWSREVRVLPIARCVALRSAWLAALALPVAIMTGRLLAALVQFVLGFALTRDVETIALAALWDAVYIGMSLTLAQWPDTPWRGVRESFGNLRGAGRILVAMVWLAVPLARPELVPQSLGHVTWLHVAGILLGVVVTAWPLMTAPDQWPSFGVLHDAARDTGVEPVRAERRERWLDRLVGMRRLWPGQIAGAAIVSLLTLAASTAIVASRRSLQSPFAANTTDVEFFLIGGPLFLLILGPFGWASGLTPLLRRLKSLPVSARQIAVTITALPLMTPMFFWTFAMGIHLAVDAPADGSWRLGSLSFLCGVMALSGAVNARLNSAVFTMVGSFAPMLGVLIVMTSFGKVTAGSIIASAFPLVGLIGVPAAFLLNYRTVTRGFSSSATYRAAPGESLYRGGRP